MSLQVQFSCCSSQRTPAVLLFWPALRTKDCSTSTLNEVMEIWGVNNLTKFTETVQHIEKCTKSPIKGHTIRHITYLILADRLVILQQLKHCSGWMFKEGWKKLWEKTGSRWKVKLNTTVLTRNMLQTEAASYSMDLAVFVSLTSLPWIVFF